jgi:hypothetical protein
MIPFASSIQQLADDDAVRIQQLADDADCTRKEVVRPRFIMEEGRTEVGSYSDFTRMGPRLGRRWWPLSRS